MSLMVGNQQPKEEEEKNRGAHNIFKILSNMCLVLIWWFFCKRGRIHQKWFYILFKKCPFENFFEWMGWPCPVSTGHQETLTGILFFFWFPSLKRLEGKTGEVQSCKITVFAQWSWVGVITISTFIVYIDMEVCVSRKHIMHPTHGISKTFGQEGSK